MNCDWYWNGEIWKCLKCGGISRKISKLSSNRKSNKKDCGVEE